MITSVLAPEMKSLFNQWRERQSRVQTSDGKRAKLPFIKGVPVKWLVDRGLPPDYLPADFPDRPEDERRYLLWEAAATARARKGEEAFQAKRAAWMKKWNLPANFYDLSEYDRDRLYAAARQRHHRAKPLKPSVPIPPEIEALLGDLEPPPRPPQPIIVPMTRGEIEGRTKRLDEYLALNGRSQRILRRHRNLILAGWIRLGVFRQEHGRDPSGGEFALVRKSTRNSALKLLARIRDLERPGMPWAISEDSQHLRPAPGQDESPPADGLEGTHA